MISLDSSFTKLVLFALVEWVGYFVFLHVANRLASKGQTPLTQSVLVSAAALRLALGVVAGLVVQVVLLRVPALPNRSLIVLAAFLPIRAGLWYLILRMFFDREQRRTPLVRRLTAFGVITSYLLDVPAIFVGANVLGSIA